MNPAARSTEIIIGQLLDLVGSIHTVSIEEHVKMHPTFPFLSAMLQFLCNDCNRISYALEAIFRSGANPEDRLVELINMYGYARSKQSVKDTLDKVIARYPALSHLLAIPKCREAMLKSTRL